MPPSPSVSTKLPNPVVPWNKGYLDLAFKAGTTITIPFH
jgi:hypothetical protein